MGLGDDRGDRVKYVDQFHINKVDHIWRDGPLIRFRIKKGGSVDYLTVNRKRKAWGAERDRLFDLPGLVVKSCNPEPSKGKITFQVKKGFATLTCSKKMDELNMDSTTLTNYSRLLQDLNYQRVTDVVVQIDSGGAVVRCWTCALGNPPKYKGSRSG